MNFIKIDCLYSKIKDKKYIITKHNYKRCQSLWMKDRNRFTRIDIKNIEEAIKYNKQKQYGKLKTI